MDSVSLTADERVALDGLTSELRRVFAARLHSVAVYGLHAPAASPRLLHTLALVERLSFEDLAACAPFAPGWRRRNLAVPLILEREEFLRTLDIFPLEYGDIVAHHVLVAGADPFADARISPADVRRACELSAKSHLVHLREGFMETGGEPQRLAGSSPPRPPRSVPFWGTSRGWQTRTSPTSPKQRSGRSEYRRRLSAKC